MIPPELKDMLEPLEEFERIRRKVVRRGSSLADLSYANPYAGATDAVKDAIRAVLDEDRLLDLQYTPFGGQTLARRAVADALRESHGLDFGFGDIVLTPGAMGALHLALRAAGGPGDEVIIPFPCWLDYPLYARSLGLEPVLVPLAEDSFDLDLDAIASAITERTCAVLMSLPGNPSGRNYSAGSLAELGSVLRDGGDRVGRDITLIADEVHRDFVPAGEYQTTASFFDRCLIVYSFGKYHFIQGQRLGYVAVSPRHPARADVAHELVAWTRITGLCTPTAVMQRAIPRLLALRHDDTWLLRWRARLYDELTDAGYRVVRPDATLFMYVQVPDGLDDLEFVEHLAREGLLVLPAAAFHHRGYFRLALTGSDEMLERATPILRQVAAWR